MSEMAKELNKILEDSKKGTAEERIDVLASIIEDMMQLVLTIPGIFDDIMNQVSEKLSSLESKLENYEQANKIKVDAEVDAKRKFLDEIISEYKKSGKPALTVLIPEKVIRKYGLSSVSIYEFEGKKYAVSGINVINGQQIKEQQEEEVIINCSPEAIFSVNSLRDMELAKNFWLKNQR